MSDIIVDTNVAVVANRQNENVVESCIDACILFLSQARREHVVIIDSGDQIRAEYAKALIVSRPHGLGALFLFGILQQQYNPDRVRRVQLEMTDDGNYVDFPDVPELYNFDHDDRKFAALSRLTGVAVSSAVDSDWADCRTSLNANGIELDFVCGCDKTLWFVG